jgi:hypothetical protein
MKNRTPKKTMALKMLSKRERDNKVTPFNSIAWMNRESQRRLKELAKRK